MMTRNELPLYRVGYAGAACGDAPLRPIRAIRAIRAEGMEAAASVAADRLARRVYGRTGYVRTLRCDSWAEDGTSANYEAFIGYSPRGTVGETTGHNVWLYVSVS